MLFAETLACEDAHKIPVSENLLGRPLPGC